MRIPRTLLIGRTKWRVKQVKGLHRRTGCVGLCERHLRLIRLDHGQPQKDKETTLLHEVLHAIFPYNLVGDATEERIVEWLDSRLREVITKNRLFGERNESPVSSLSRTKRSRGGNQLRGVAKRKAPVKVRGRRSRKH